MITSVRIGDRTLKFKPIEQNEYHTQCFYFKDLLNVSINFFLGLLVALLVKNPPAVQEAWVYPWVGKIPWRRERLPTPVFWPGEFHGLCSPWGRKESDTTDRLSLNFSL